MSEEVVQVYKYTSYGDIHYENYSDAIVVKTRVMHADQWQILTPSVQTMFVQRTYSSKYAYFKS